MRRRGRERKGEFDPAARNSSGGDDETDRAGLHFSEECVWAVCPRGLSSLLDSRTENGRERAHAVLSAGGERKPHPHTGCC